MDSLPLDLTKLENLEASLNKITEKELKIELEKSSLYEHLHNEKISPIFLKSTFFKT